jgi:integrase/recombinase XerD
VPPRRQQTKKRKRERNPGLRLVFQAAARASVSAYRVLDSANVELDWLNAFLDVQLLRGLSPRSLRAYGYDLLHFARWWNRADLSKLTEANVLDYVRHQLERIPKPSAQTVNHRLTVLRCVYRFHYQGEVPGAPHLKPARPRYTYGNRTPMGYGATRRSSAGLRVKQARRVVVPLSAQEVAQFWRSFRTFRDLSLIALMLLDGLRSRELIELQLDDLRLSQAQLRVRGKGNRERLLPLPADTIQALQDYLRLERPEEHSPYLFVCLKGRQRGQPMTPAGLRSLFRHHRKVSQVAQANPHRFRHTFGADMVRAGVSLPALMHLMGHAQIRTTMLYVQLSPQDVWREYARALENRARLDKSEQAQ